MWCSVSAPRCWCCTANMIIALETPLSKLSLFEGEVHQGLASVKRNRTAGGYGEWCVEGSGGLSLEAVGSMGDTRAAVWPGKGDAGWKLQSNVAITPQLITGRAGTPQPPPQRVVATREAHMAPTSAQGVPLIAASSASLSASCLSLSASCLSLSASCAACCCMVACACARACQHRCHRSLVTQCA